jgi:rhodanese-related sulfurtransferase
MEIPRISISEVAECVANDEPVAFVDARSAKAYGMATVQLPGSTRIPPDAEVRPLAASLPREALVVAYCTWHAEQSSARVALQLRRLGFSRAFALTGGFDAWKSAGLPLEALAAGEVLPNRDAHQPL